MKKLFLLLLATLVLLGGEAFAQRRTATESVSIGSTGGNMTYSYIIKDGERVYDGPLTIKASQDSRRKIYMYGSYRWDETKRDYSLSANYRDDWMNGAIKVNDSYYSSLSGTAPTTENTTFTGSFVDGVPNGKFFLDKKVVYNDQKFSSVYVSATYKMGVFTGAFSFKDFYYYEDAFKNSPRCEIKGSFTSDGKMNGDWRVYYSRGAYNENECTYKFKNGVLVGGGPTPIDAATAAIAVKYASGQISLKELAAKGLMVYKTRFDAYGYADRDNANLYEDVRKCISTVIHYDITRADEVLNSYGEIVKIPYLSDADFKSAIEDIKRSLEARRTFYSMYADVDNILTPYEDTGLYYYGSRIMTDAQAKCVSDLVESSNLKLDNKYKSDYISKIKQDYLDRAEKEITVDGKSYDVVAVRMGSINRETKKISVEIDSREYGKYTGKNYILVTHKTEYDGNKFGNLVPIRNKYDDIVDAKAAFNKEAESQLDKANTVVKEKQATYLNGVTNQLTIFRNYVAQINRTQTNHNNLDATIKTFKEQTEVVKVFSGYMSQYIESYKLDEQIKQKQIAKHTSTPIPTVANWSKNAKVEVLTKVIADQQNILKLWEKFSPLKAQVVEAHKQFSSSNDAVLSKYNAEYAALVNGKITLEAGIEAYPKLLEEQKVVAEQWQKYKELKAQAEKAHEQIGVTDDTALTKYKAMYNETAAKTVLAEAVEAYAKLVEEQKIVAEQWKTYNDLKCQLTDINNQICAGKLAVMGAYSSWYDANVNPQTSLEEGIATYTKLAAIQQSANEYIPLYNKVVENNTLLADALKPAKCAAKAYKLYFKELDLNWKSEGALEKINKILENQSSLLAISKRPTLKEDEKRVKKLKLTNLEDIIKAYLN